MIWNCSPRPTISCLSSGERLPCWAAARLSGVPARGCGQRMCVSPENVIRLNVSCGRRAPIALVMTSLAFSIGKPLMEPDVSSTKTSSRGTACASGTRAGGCRISVKKLPCLPVWAKFASSIVSAVCRQVRTKSRLGISTSCLSSIVVRRGRPSSRGTMPLWMTSCSSDLMSRRPGPPVSSVTRMLLSWPARLPGLTGSGVIRPASGT